MVKFTAYYASSYMRHIGCTTYRSCPLLLPPVLSLFHPFRCTINAVKRLIMDIDQPFAGAQYRSIACADVRGRRRL